MMLSSSMISVIPKANRKAVEKLCMLNFRASKYQIVFSRIVTFTIKAAAFGGCVMPHIDRLKV